MQLGDHISQPPLQLTFDYITESDQGDLNKTFWVGLLGRLLERGQNAGA